MANPTDYYPARYSANYRRHKNDACFRWRPPTKSEAREIVRRYHAGQNEIKPPLDVIEFQRQLHGGVSNRFHAGRGAELHHDGFAAAPRLVPAPRQEALERYSRS
jgi:hypothetical protein